MADRCSVKRHLSAQALQRRIAAGLDLSEHNAAWDRVGAGCDALLARLKAEHEKGAGELLFPESDSPPIRPMPMPYVIQSGMGSFETAAMGRGALVVERVRRRGSGA